MKKIKLELLSPAKDLQTGIAAIDCGADAVYIGAPSFGAREAAGNPIEDIAELVNYAHKFWAKVYVTVNTIIYDDEIKTVQNLIHNLYDIGVDAIIFQDMALLEMDIPPIQLYASTQTHNYELEKIKLLDELGIKRIILARELSLDEIKKIKNNVSAELEFFIHGALCISLSGQCYMSFDSSGRSANRGECSQNCRLPYSLVDANNNVIIKDKHLLSLKDLNLSYYLNDLIDAGITSFKIEGRLKDIAYVKNITAYYRQLIDDIIKNKPHFQKSSSGYSIINFQPDPEKTFNRGYTNYFINDRSEKVSSHKTPKSIGKYLGKVIEIDKFGFSIATNEKIHTGDGICFFDSNENLIGFNVSKVEENKIFTNDFIDVKLGSKIFRNFDYSFNKELEKDCKRKIETEIYFTETTDGFTIKAKDEDNIEVEEFFFTQKEIAINKNLAFKTLKNNLSKSGSTIFNVKKVVVDLSNSYFFNTKQINEFRRIILDKLEYKRIENHKREVFVKKITNIKVAERLDYKSNVVNSLSKIFYENLGAREVEPGFELLNNHKNKTVMTCKYCIKDELGLCPFDTDKKLNEPLFLVNENKKYELIFNCKECLMEIITT